MKKFQKLIDSDSEIFNFHLIGSGEISMKDLKILEENKILIETPTTSELNGNFFGWLVFGSANKSPAASLNRSFSNSFASSVKGDQISCYYGYKLNYWYKAMAEFGIAPNILSCDFARFSAKSNVVYSFL